MNLAYRPSICRDGCGILASMKPRLTENVVYAAVQRGELEIDEKGRVWRIKERRGNRWGGPALTKPCSPRRAEHDTGQYLQVAIRVGGKTIAAMAHRLVWRHLHGPIPLGLTINHKNGKKKDNDPSNLELATPSENTRHAYRMGLRDEHGEGNPAHKLTDCQVEAIRTLYAIGTRTQVELAEMFGVKFQAISKIVRGDRRPKQRGPTANYVSRRARGIRGRDDKGRFRPA